MIDADPSLLTLPDDSTSARVSFEQHRPTEDTSTALHHYIPSGALLRSPNNEGTAPIESANGALPGKEGKQKLPAISGNLSDNPALNEKIARVRPGPRILISDRSSDLGARHPTSIGTYRRGGSCQNNVSFNRAVSSLLWNETE